ncbi:class II lanthipeptide, LchA2/BrtA2 family [Bacillus pseudomycoides]|uniref:Class II lanthipeptide, LchA2/BrtA2 family n=1 Tax=Bacillus bingmayongensis TaxID=1150157 RepID=A0ABU5JS34_9BACI|nr:class II lanthipeptide, LchA2/BrtA2 family [Bacillus pseudomycoides]WJE53132.1 class II lanthipeptide, LchA2/BrtA2 family [Bacillus cereus]WJE53133.1 class II lanthipeptide, LchA2/BrtA2 family [Bacillus cereus]WJE53134.1 class II lanthipeptide, LchA2/BrtA2 family [Bacillus cereus]
MKKYNGLEEVVEQELMDLAGGNDESQPQALTPTTITIPISLWGCPTTSCASIVSSCN